MAWRKLLLLLSQLLVAGLACAHGVTAADKPPQFDAELQRRVGELSETLRFQVFEPDVH